MNPADLSTTIVEALTALVDDGRLTLPDGVPSQVTVERPRQKGHGDYATNVALQLAKKAGTNPRALGDLLAEQLRAADGVAAVDVAGPGFLNITVAAGAQGQVAADVVAAGAAYGSSDAFAGEKINLEFVSANPTGPLHIGGVRWAAVGDALGRIFTKTGAEVTREYYFNDHGGQIDRFSGSLLASAHGRPVPEDGYGGAYIDDIAQAVLVKHPGTLDLPDDEAQEVFRAEGVEMMFAEIKESLHQFGVDFDVYFHEDNLHASGAVQKAIDRLTELGNTYEQDGALWLRTERFGDDKDRVIIRSDGNGSYFSGDLAYYLDKRSRGFDRCFIMLGADHHGYVGRMMAMCAAFGDEPHVNLEILIGQMVNLLRDGQPLRMSKRAGTVVTIEDLVDAIGVDAAALRPGPLQHRLPASTSTWTCGPSAPTTTRCSRSSTPTPGSARSSATPPTWVSRPESHPELLTHEKEGDLLRALAEFPRVVKAAAELREPHRLARYLEELARTYHRFYDNCRVLPHGRRGAQRPAPGATAARRGDAHRAGQRPRACSVSPPRSGCSR